ncbi:MAG: oligosaccharide flippase family protein [Candidatus Aenigmarchaeota archaeon]|nr:oligosaccharide flippase family protein [Candidatus Aenigmarchaeota archaeon]
MKKHVVAILKSDLAKTGSIIFIATLSSNLIVFLANLLIANQLGAVDFGVFKIILYLFSFLPLLIEFGVNASLTKYISEFGSKNKEKIGYLVNWFLKLKVATYLILIIIIFLLREQISIIFLKDPSLSYLISAGILLISLTFFGAFQFIVQGFQKFKLYALSQFLNLSSSAILAILLSPLGIFYIILGWSLGPLIGNLFNIKFFFDKKILKKTKEFDVKKIFLKFSIPIYLTNIVVGLLNAVVPFLSLFFSQEKIGFFSFAFIFYSATLLIPMALSAIVFPKVSELNGLKRHEDAKNILMKAFKLYLIVAIIGIILVFLVSDWLFTTFFSGYMKSLFMFKILTIIGLIFGFNTIYFNYLQGLGKVKRFALFVLTQNILLIIISFILLSS